MFDVALLTDLVLAGGLVAAVVAGWWRLRGLVCALRLETSARQQVEHEMQALLACSRELGARYQAQSQDIEALRLQVMQLGRTAEPQPVLADAQRLLDEGLDVTRVASLCELSQGEAALLAKWNQRRGAA
jgi:hypothetical protein